MGKYRKKIKDIVKYRKKIKDIVNYSKTFKKNKSKFPLAFGQ